MSKKMLKRSLALGALMAFVITGSAMAADRVVNSAGTEEKPVVVSDTFEKLTGASGGAINNSGVLSVEKSQFNNNKATSSGGAIYNTGTLTVTESEFTGNTTAKTTKRPYGGAISNVGGTLTVEDSTFTNNGTSGYSSYGSVIYTTNNGTTSIIGSTFDNNVGDASNGIIYATSGSKLTLSDNKYTNNGRAIVNAEAGAEVNFAGTNTFGNNTTNDVLIRGIVTFAEASKTVFDTDSTGADIGIYGTGKVVLKEGSIVTAGNGVLGLSGSQMTINYAKLEIGGNSEFSTLDGTNGAIKFLDDVELNVENNETNGLTFAASGVANDAVGGDANKLLEGFNFNGTENTQMVLDEGNLQGRKVVNLFLNENNELEEIEVVSKEVNTKSDAVSNAGMVLKAHYRAHMNDMNKRMGELRFANGENGVWTRMVRGESEYQGAKIQYNQYQLGYDEKLSIDKRWTVGAAVTFSEGDASYGQGSTEDKSTAFAIYGSKLNNDGTFVDLIARYAHLDSDIEDNVYGNGDYNTNGMSVSAEFGKRIQQGNGLWIEPQIELTYGTVDSADFRLDNGYNTHFDSMDSFITRVGFSIGKDIERGNVYARASYLYDFDGETETQFVGGDPIKEDFGGGWWEVGVGANIKLSNATYIYADIEKTFGGEVDTNWQWNLGVRYSF